jgi:hypothetical protein
MSLRGRSIAGDKSRHQWKLRGADIKVEPKHASDDWIAVMVGGLRPGAVAAGPTRTRAIHYAMWPRLRPFQCGEQSGAAGGMQGTTRLLGQTVVAVFMTSLFTQTSAEIAPRIGFGI